MSCSHDVRFQLKIKVVYSALLEVTANPLVFRVGR